MTTGIVNGKEKPTVLTLSGGLSQNEGDLLFQGEIASVGKSEIIERGFYWSMVSNDPGINDSIVVVLPDATSDIFVYEFPGASGEKTYYWRAYAKNSYGYDYGKVDSCQTPKIWIKKNSLSPIERGQGVIFVIDDKIYMTCGKYVTGSALVNETWEYNIANNTWNQMEYFSGDYRIYPVTFTIGNSAFVGTGWRASGVAFNDFYRYDNTSNLWTAIATPDNLEARYKAVAFSLNGKGYLVGGLSLRSGALKDVWQYNVKDSSWQRKNDFPVSFSGGINICGNNRVFAGFGEASESARILWEYNEGTDRWNEFSVLPDTVGKIIYSGVIVGNFIYIVDENNVIWTCNTSGTKTWTKKTDLPSAFLNNDGKGGNQTLLTTGDSNSVYVGLGFTKLLYEYRPLWDN